MTLKELKRKRKKKKKHTNKPVFSDDVLVTFKHCSNNYKVLAIPSPTSNAFILRGRTQLTKLLYICSINHL